ncbi:MAG: CotH kinase family protein [Clostridia bacterium]|nr:CotH kinase family protein [Clostridia bacterium]
MLRRLWFILLLIVLFGLPLGAQAREISRLYVWDGGAPLPEDGSLPAGAIQWYKRGDTNRYLYLPAGLDAGNLRVRITGADSFTVDGVTVENNTVTNVFVPGETVTIANGGSVYHVIVMQSENTASVYLKTQSGKIDWISESKRNHEPGSIYVLDENGKAAFGNDFEYIRVRGNYSFYPYKKSFHIKLNDSAPMLGMPSAKTWLLIASYRDNAMIRNAMTFDLAAAAGMAHTCEYRFAEVYVNTVYYGTYIFCEKIQIQKNRIDVFDLEKATEKLNDKELSKYKRLGTNEYKRNTAKYYDIPNTPEDVSGGYLLQLELDERYTSSASGFVTSHGQPVLVKSPEYVSKGQMQYIQSLVQSFENAIWAEDGVDPDTGKHYSEIADMSSLVGKYLVEEITKNVDGNKSSYYLYKYTDDVSDKLFFGPVWDYDIAYGNYTASYYKERNLPSGEGLMTAEDDYKRYYWFPRLYQHEDFRQAVKEAYVTRFRPCLEVILGLREPTEDTGSLLSLSGYEQMLASAADMNFSRWRTFNDSTFPVKTGADFQENIEFIRQFLSSRLAYLDSLWLE